MFQVSTPSIETPPSQTTTEIEIASNVENLATNEAPPDQLKDTTIEDAPIVKSDEGTKCKLEDNDSK